MIDCGSCFECCGANIPCTKDDKKIIERYAERNGITPESGKGEKYCRRLDKEGRCKIYSVRPKTCMVYGYIKNKHMQCFHYPEEATVYDKDFDKYGKKVIKDRETI